MWGLETKLHDWLKDSPTSNADFLSIPQCLPLLAPAAQLQLYHIASKSYSLKPSPKLLPQLAGSPLLSTGHPLQAHTISDAGLSVPQMDIMSYILSHKEPKN